MVEAFHNYLDLSNPYFFPSPQVGGQKMLKYADDLLTIIEGMLEDSSSAHKQEVVVRTLGQVVASTGLVVEPYNRFPNLLMILLNMLVTEPEQIVRKEVSKKLQNLMYCFQLKLT